MFRVPVNPPVYLAEVHYTPSQIRRAVLLGAITFVAVACTTFWANLIDEYGFTIGSARLLQEYTAHWLFWGVVFIAWAAIGGQFGRMIHQAIFQHHFTRMLPIVFQGLYKGIVLFSYSFAILSIALCFACSLPRNVRYLARFLHVILFPPQLFLASYGLACLATTLLVYRIIYRTPTLHE